jgi:hypothetical protein
MWHIEPGSGSGSSFISTGFDSGLEIPIATANFGQLHGLMSEQSFKKKRRLARSRLFCDAVGSG